MLRALSEMSDGAARLGTLAEATYLPQPSMSRLVERMDKAGLVSRCSAPDDGRGRLVRLTEQGRERYREVGRRHLRSIHQNLSAGLGEDEARMLTSLLVKLRVANEREQEIA